VTKLDSTQIAWELERLGATLYRAPMYAMTYVLPGTAERVCVKRGQGGKPMAKQPLVVHPRHRDASAFAALSALLGQPNPAYKNADLHGFPLSEWGASKTGMAFDVPDAGALRQALVLLGAVMPFADEDPQLVAARLELAADPNVASVGETERQQLVAARIGQGKFRADLLKYWNQRCAVSGSCVSEVLIASHIKPWASSSNRERLDPYNGLLLAAHVDRLFDRGLVSFSDQGQLLHGDRLPAQELPLLGLSGGSRLLRVEAQHLVYLAEHRRVHGFA
jgi:putative restriction endonuclease